MKKCFKIFFKILKWILIILISIIVLFLIVRTIGRKINDRTPDGGINETMYVDINGTKQWINIYGQDKDAPVLLYLHGGPGSPTSDVDYPVLRKLSDIYTVVNWDQRACGHSWTKEQTNIPITYDMLFSDGEEMTKFLLDYLHKDKISIMGISWGAEFGAHLVLDHPEYYDVLIAMSWPIDDIETQKAFKEQALEWTKDDPELHQFAENIITDESVFDTMTWQERSDAMQEQYTINYKYCEPDDIFAGDVPIIPTMIFGPYYSLKDYYYTYIAVYDYIDYNDPSSYCYAQCTQICSYKGLSVLDRTDHKVPVYVIMGDKDYTVMTSVTKAYYDKIIAPDKAYYEVEGGHYMPMIQSERLSEIVHEIYVKNS